MLEDVPLSILQDDHVCDVNGSVSMRNHFHVWIGNHWKFVGCAVVNFTECFDLKINATFDGNNVVIHNVVKTILQQKYSIIKSEGPTKSFTIWTWWILTLSSWNMYMGRPCDMVVWEIKDTHCIS